MLSCKSPPIEGLFDWQTRAAPLAVACWRIPSIVMGVLCVRRNLSGGEFLGELRIPSPAVFMSPWTSYRCAWTGASAIKAPLSVPFKIRWAMAVAAT